MSGHRGKRAAAAPGRRPRATVLGYGLGITLAVLAWGYLVWAAIDFGSTARDGDGRAWWFLGLAALGAVACLFLGLLLVARLTRALGEASRRSPAPRAGGKRAAR